MGTQGSAMPARRLGARGQRCWYWWAGAIAAATLALINLSVYLRTQRERHRPPDP
jgi:hypothetical protein